MSTDPSQPSHGKFKKAMHGGSRHSLFYLSDPPPPPQSPLPEQQPLTESPPCQQTTSTNPPPNEPDDHTSHENTHENTPDSETTIPSNHTGPAQEYLVKTIRWVDFHTREAKDVRIITQNENGPCPLVAICNVLFLRGDLEIRPPDREVVTFEYLVERLGDYLLNHGPSTTTNTTTTTTTTNNQDKPSSTPTSPNDDDTTIMIRSKSSAQSSTQEYVLTYRYNLDAALSILPNLQTGLDVNVRFSSIRDFEPTAELAMFDLFDVDLFHGWVVDPQDEETYRVVAEKCGSYNAVVECVVRADTLNDKKDWTQEDEVQMHEGLVASSFLDDTATQLTYYGLQQLADTVTPNKPFVFFRNNHTS
ncbi:fam63a protein [Lichtheimia corymbifera JMRC:FSU:9682]|uniref:Fam63a protein n=1 Tax=Lichtheimia corymbifera JMRC:FSU:9682 TaxID=1263082 RepID=A0A068S1M6_9FUNG|nr:fam63a protein [Lichtheimia corymbifera JMRC:FSU:9682]